MSYIEGIADEPFDLQASYDEAMADLQMKLDAIARIGRYPDTTEKDMRFICGIAGINCTEFLNHKGVTA